MQPKKAMKKIQTKIMILIMIAALGVSLINVALSTVISRRSTLTAIEQTLSETTSLAALAAQNMISTYTLTISEVASSPLLSDPEISPAEKQAFIQTKVNTYYMRFGGMADTTGYDSVHDVTISGQPFFQAALEGKTYMSTPYISDDDMFMIISAPVTSAGAVQGVVYFQCDTYLLQSIIDEIQIGENGDAYILDKEGTTIAALETEEVLSMENLVREMPSNPNDKYIQELGAIEQKMIAGEQGVGEYTYPGDNVDYMQGYAPIPGTDGWSVGVTISEDEFLRYAYIGNNIQLVVGVLLCILVILLSAPVCKSFTGPIVKCANRLHQLSEGDLKSPLPQVNTQDETRILSDSTAHLVENFRCMLAEIGTVLNSIAGGDLTADSLRADYPGDFLALREDLEAINDKLNQTLGGISQASGQVSNSSAQVASSSTALSQGSTEQASAVVELSSTLSDMDKDAKKTVQLSQQTKNAVDGAQEQLLESNRNIEDLNRAMELITASSNEIKHIIDTIEDIALQTNILALNASVEAARAGEAGKGFAVVSGEVRSLAGKTAEASKSTAALIEHSIAAVEEGALIADATARQLEGAVAQAQEIVGTINDIADDARTQAEAMEQIQSQIGQIASVAQNNSATAQESSATSEELSDQAGLLRQLVKTFRLRRGQ